ncbi:MAG: RNA polymerase sigma factor [Cellvibrionaceae bacterium]|nr:RNA polymerase sigma factor [Cellvibrionaceae bacterium]
MIEEQDLNRLYRYALSLSADADLAYDLVHGAIGRFLEPPMPELEDPIPYLMRSIRNAFIDIKRRDTRYQHEVYDDEGLPQDYDIRALESLSIDQKFITQLLNQLNSQEREILYLWAVEGYSTSEVADLLNMPKGTLLSKIYRLRNRLLSTAFVKDALRNGGSYYV